MIIVKLQEKQSEETKHPEINGCMSKRRLVGSKGMQVFKAFTLPNCPAE